MEKQRKGRGTGTPNLRPLTRAELLRNKVTRAGIRDNYCLVDYGMYVPNDQLLPELAESGYRRERRVHPGTLTIAHLLRHPGRIGTGFAAGSIFGMKYFVDEEPLEFFASTGTRRSGAPGHILLTPTRRLGRYREGGYRITGLVEPLTITSPATSLSMMLKTVSTPDTARTRRWRVPDLRSVRPFLSPQFIRGVQVSDALRQALGPLAPEDPADLLVPGGADASFAAAVLGYTDGGAESPPETLLRLVVSDLAPGLRSQIPIWEGDGDRLLTVADVGWEDRGLFLFYDGVHHLQRGQRDHDSTVWRTMQRDGKRVLRITAGALADADAVTSLREEIDEALRQ